MVTVLILFVLGLFYVNAQPGEEHFEAIVSLILVIVVAYREVPNKTDLEAN